MAKRVQLVLSEDVVKLGKSGDMVEVAPGYARNYLIPRGLGLRVTPGILKQVERRREAERLRKLEEKQTAEAQKTAIATIGLLRIAKPVGEGDSIFGTVTNREVADVLKSFAGIDVDHRNIDMPEINHLGKFDVQVKLHPEVSATVNIEVVAE
jgi:large subunit ribosomal protein L9